MDKIENKINLSPAWKEALKRFIELEPKPGDLLKKSWLLEVFCIDRPVTAEQKAIADLEYLQQFTRFREELLSEHRIELAVMIGEGYKVVAPREQTKLAITTRTKKIGKQIKKMCKSISCVDTSALTDVERCEHTDGLAKAATINAMFSRRKLLGRVD